VKCSAAPALILLPLLAACTGSLFQSKAAAPTIYQLSAAAPRVAAATPAAPPPAVAIPADLAVLKPNVRTGLDTDRIAVFYPDRRLDYFAAARWSGPLSEVLQDLAVQEFHSHAHLRTVSSDASVFDSAYWLEIEVSDFQAEYLPQAAAPTVRVSLLARVGTSGDRRILGQFAANAEVAASENRMSAIVDAYARAAHAAFAEIAAHSADILAKASEAR
jgi:cholesterol transport system auxiliary component